MFVSPPTHNRSARAICCMTIVKSVGLLAVYDVSYFMSFYQSKRWVLLDWNTVWIILKGSGHEVGQMED